MSKRVMGILSVIVSMLVVLTGCNGDKIVGAKAKTEKVELYVSAAASLTESMTEIVDKYNHQSEGVEWIINFASSGSLQRQIEQGAPTDVFLSASLSKMVSLKDGGYLFGEYNRLLKNEMVLIGPKDSELIGAMEDLKKDTTFVFAMGEPESVPAGKYAQQVLDYSSLTKGLKDKTVIAKDVKEVLTWVALGEADAGMVYITDAYVSEDVKILEVTSEDSHDPIIYPCGVIESCEHREEAKAFVEYLASQEAMAIFESYGFAPAD